MWEFWPYTLPFAANQNKGAKHFAASVCMSNRRGEAINLLPEIKDAILNPLSHALPPNKALPCQGNTNNAWILTYAHDLTFAYPLIPS